MTGCAPRFPLLDALKLLAAQLIFLHHLCTYGPVADAVASAWPTLAAWLFDKGRFAVQVFFVLAGYLAAQGLSQVQGWRLATSWRLAWKRYCRLVWPLAAALGLVLLTSELTRDAALGSMVPAVPHAAQLIAHLLLLQGALGFDALSVGLWYVAIDFQLFVMLLVLFALPGCLTANRDRARTATMVLTVVLMLSSLWGLNRHPEWDSWAPYFFGSYGLGACAYWARQAKQRHEWLAGLGLVVWWALLLDFRGRILLAGLTAGVLVLFNRPHGMKATASGMQRWTQLGAQRAYALFLVHFPVLLLVNAGWAELTTFIGVAPGAGMTAGAVALTCALTWVLADIFYRHIESRPLRIPTWVGMLQRRATG